MSNQNDLITLNIVLEQRNQEIAPHLPLNDYFELFVADQILKDYDLSYEQLIEGIVGGSGDGGIDSIHMFVNGELKEEDVQKSDLRSNIHIHLVITQAKNKTSFEEIVIEKFKAATDDLLNLAHDLDNLQGYYGGDLIEIVHRFRTIYRDLAPHFPELRISYYYATKGNQPTPNMTRKAEQLGNQVRNLFPRAQFDFEFLGASELLELARKPPQNPYELRVAEGPIALDTVEDSVGFICLVSLQDYYKFITDEKGDLNRVIFEANVRDYQGDNAVNRQIRDTLETNSLEDFWWLNNGITILSTKATMTGKIMTIQNPEIVNGLQTSTALYQYFHKTNTTQDGRNILIRVIKPGTSDTRG